MAVGTLTTVQVRPPAQVTGATAGAAMLLAPVAGGVLAVLAGVVFWVGLWLGLGSLVAAALAIAALRLGDRGFHLDGLADTADGLAASYDRERALAVMRTGDTGPAGASAVVLVLLVQVAAAAQLGRLEPVAAAVGLAGCVVVSRAMLMAACLRGVPSARTEGLGAVVAGSVGRVAAVGATAVVTATLAGAFAIAGWPGNEAAGAVPWWSAPVVVALALMTTGVVLWRCTRRLGGVTGDVLGAVVEVSLAAGLVALVATAG
ncbi:adenosylcobinamide-GDP ribazoletransferase [Phytoactinopolyspora sp. XMNu-373]|uniref:Adenosylcobinamide-GDP ribazoletransferase n=1 Tax=Phytoactinopolyspora mesophila TaxID=2650750 RepID=A0A7K3MAI1_9ACTN|nr:adenosylcobinamide-GDP ribazoletransferase [Phytoactinopolyspora mesophila]